jgi:hypothetical protein
MAPQAKVTATPRKSAKVKVSEITEDERRARTQSNHDEWRKLIQLSATKNLRIECEDYREARTLAQKLTAVRSYYGYEVRIQHRGKEIFLSPRESVVDLDMVAVESKPPEETP